MQCAELPHSTAGVFVNERYERGSIMLISNQAPEEWPDLFGSPLLASAGLDRLTHRAHMIVITGSSFRAHGPQDPGKEVPIESTACPWRAPVVCPFFVRSFTSVTSGSGPLWPKTNGPMTGEN